MPEDNVIRPTFGSRKVETAKENSPLRKASLRDFAGSVGSGWEGKIRIRNERGEVKEGDGEMLRNFASVLSSFEIGDVLHRLISRNERKIQQYQSIVESYSDEEIERWLNNPKDSDLQRKPYFFHALIDEAKRRFLFK